MDSKQLGQVLKAAEASFVKGTSLSLKVCMEKATEALRIVATDKLQHEEIGSLQSQLFMLRGKARILYYAQKGDISLLHKGHKDLREALKNLPASACQTERMWIEEELAIALVRCGEQLSQSSLLKEAINTLGEIYEGNRKPSERVEYYRILNAYCLANSRLGYFSGDPTMNEAVCEKLRLYLKESDSEAETLTLKTLVIALTDLGRLSRKEEIYNELILLIENYLAKGHQEALYLRRHRITAWIELAWWKSFTNKSARTVPDLEAAFDEIQLLMKEPAVGTSMRVELLHTAAQAKARIAIELKSEAFMREAISYCGKSLDLIQRNTDQNDGRLPRLFSDRASYRAILARRNQSKHEIKQVIVDYEKASSLIKPQASPWVSAKIQSRMFHFLFDCGEYVKALEAFEIAEQIWEIVICDETLSSRVLSQLALEMSEHYTRASRCFLELEKPDQAILCSDRGRAIQMRYTQIQKSNPSTDLEDSALSELEQAANFWEKTRNEGDEAECVKAWQNYSDIRRRLGISNEIEKLEVKNLQGLIPKHGALVQILFVDEWISSLVVTNNPLSFCEVEVPEDFKTSLLDLVSGEERSTNNSWKSSYEHYITMPIDNEDADYEQRQFETWDEQVSRGIRLLGQSLLNPIHQALKNAGIKPQAKIILLPAGNLAALPIVSALVEDQTSFDENWEVSLIPNLSMLERIKSRGEEGKNHNCLIVSQIENDQYAKLPFASRESSLLNNIIPSSRLKMLQGSKANLATVLSELSKASVIHFACHGRYVSEYPEKSGIQLASNKWLTVSRLKSTAESMLKNRLVFLSCCETGILGKSSLSDEFVGLLSTLLECGVRASIGALWPVCDDSAMLISWRFYKEFLDDNGNEKKHPSIALACAKKWLSSVDLATLINEGLITVSEGVKFAESRFGSVRLRRYGKASSLEKGIDTISDSEAIASIGELKIYSSPNDWAAYVVVGI